MNRKIILIVIFLLIVFSGGVLLLSKEAKAPPTESPSPSSSPSQKTETPADKPVEAKSGDFFSINLEANPTTGYSWKTNFDSDYIRLIDNTFSASSELLGASGLETFNFVSLKSGETEITFSYQRSWEKDVAPVKTQDYKVVIK